MTDAASTISFSVVSPAFNQAAPGFIQATIASVQAQMPGPYEYEHVIVDDGSTDDTREVVAALAADDPHIRYVHQDNAGVAHAYRRGFAEARGEYVVVLDGDDLLTPDSLAVRARFLLERPEARFVYARAESFSDGDVPVEEHPFDSVPVVDDQYETMFLSNFIHNGTVLASTEALRSIEFPEWLTWGQDYFMWLELLRPERAVAAHFLDAVVMRYRRHAGGYTSAMDERRLLELRRATDRIRRLHLPEDRDWFFGEQVVAAHEKITEQMEFIARQATLIDEQIDALDVRASQVAVKDAYIAELEARYEQVVSHLPVRAYLRLARAVRSK